MTREREREGPPPGGGGAKSSGRPAVGSLDGAAALRREQAAEDAPPRRPEALWPQGAPKSDPADVPGTDPDGVDQEAFEPDR